jgi:hypothetical protein
MPGKWFTQNGLLSLTVKAQPTMRVPGADHRVAHFDMRNFRTHGLNDTGTFVTQHNG